jgi:hypothetical protein
MVCNSYKLPKRGVRMRVISLPKVLYSKSHTPDPKPQTLLNSNAFGQVAWLIDIRATQVGDVIGQKLQWHDV